MKTKHKEPQIKEEPRPPLSDNRTADVKLSVVPESTLEGATVDARTMKTKRIFKADELHKALMPTLEKLYT